MSEAIVRGRVSLRIDQCAFILLATLFTPTVVRAANDHASAAQHALARAAAYLWSQQGEDGGWHSDQYAVLRSGRALTPYVLHALLCVPEDVAPRPAGGVRRALEFIRQHVDEHGALGRADPDILEYPVYSTSYALQCLLIAGKADDATRIERMVNFLLAAQYDESDGFTTADLAYGGWGFDAAKTPGEAGHMDLAHTRRALEALAMTNRAAKRPGRKASSRGRMVARADAFLAIVQKYQSPTASTRRPQPHQPETNAPAEALFDGGFYFSPTVLMANKGRIADEPSPHWRSYATATCDGLLALLATGAEPTDVRVEAAVEWLRDHARLDYPQGIPTDYPEPWGEAVRYYHYAVRAEAYRRLDWLEWAAAERSELGAAVAREQRGDGSFVNEASPLMKEDEPLLCTALAAVALTNAQ